MRHPQFRRGVGFGNSGYPLVVSRSLYPFRGRRNFFPPSYIIRWHTEILLVYRFCYLAGYSFLGMVKDVVDTKLVLDYPVCCQYR